MSFTISGFASVVVSPTSAKLEIPAITRRMILPERVFGMSSTIQTFFGRASRQRASQVGSAAFACPMDRAGGWQ